MRYRGGDRPFPWRCAVTQRRLDQEYIARGGWETKMRHGLRVAAEARRQQLKELSG